MIEEITFRQEGESLGTTLPKAMTDRLNLAAGDKAFAVETPVRLGRSALMGA